MAGWGAEIVPRGGGVRQGRQPRPAGFLPDIRGIRGIEALDDGIVADGEVFFRHPLRVMEKLPEDAAGGRCPVDGLQDPL